MSDEQKIYTHETPVQVHSISFVEEGGEPINKPVPCDTDRLNEDKKRARAEMMALINQAVDKANTAGIPLVAASYDPYGHVVVFNANQCAPANRIDICRRIKNFIDSVLEGKF